MTQSKQDLNFSSTSEVQTFVRAQLGLPSTSQQESQPRMNFQKFYNQEGTEVLQQQLQSPSKNFNTIIFRTFLNPVDYDGRIIREIKTSYQTNEVGFFITASFFGAVIWIFLKYRRTSILEQKKRFVYQQYKKQKFIEESLRIRTREELLDPDFYKKTKQIEYKDYFQK